MPLTITAIRTDFVARVDGLDLVNGLDAATFAQLRGALDDHGVLICPGQPMDDEQQLAFSRWWGPMEPTRGVNPAAGTVFARQSNLDIHTSEVIPSGDRRMDYQKGNYQWHADSTFKPVPSLCSILTARIVPPSGGNTEFVSTRAGYEDLPLDLQRKVADRVVKHSLAASRGRVGFEFTAEEKALHPSVCHPLVQVNPRTGRCSLLVGAHAAGIEGWPPEEGERFLADLLERVTRPETIHSHRWFEGDVVIWDNRSVLHRATAYDAQRHRRLMQRTTIGNPGILETAAYRRIRERHPVASA